MYRKALTGLVIVLFMSFLFSSVFSVFSDSFQNLQQNLTIATNQSLMAY